jgi:hypothetical protein
VDKLDSQKGKAKMDFQNSNPSYWSALLQNPEAIPHLKAHDTRVQGIKARLAEHIQAKRMQWVADEADKIWWERGKPRLSHPAPKWAGRQPYETWLEQAKRNVQRRIEVRFESLSTIDERMREQIIHRTKTLENQSNSRDNETRLSDRLERIEREKSNIISQMETPQSEPAAKELKLGIKHSFGQEM